MNGLRFPLVGGYYEMRGFGTVLAFLTESYSLFLKDFEGILGLSSLLTTCALKLIYDFRL